jgi:hypothetical protein
MRDVGWCVYSVRYVSAFPPSPLVKLQYVMGVISLILWVSFPSPVVRIGVKLKAQIDTEHDVQQVSKVQENRDRALMFVGSRCIPDRQQATNGRISHGNETRRSKRIERRWGRRRITT